MLDHLPWATGKNKMCLFSFLVFCCCCCCCYSFILVPLPGVPYVRSKKYVLQKRSFIISATHIYLEVCCSGRIVKGFSILMHLKKSKILPKKSVKMQEWKFWPLGPIVMEDRHGETLGIDGLVVCSKNSQILPKLIEMSYLLRGQQAQQWGATCACQWVCKDYSGSLHCASNFKWLPSPN